MVSILIPAFNQENLIAETLTSALEQDYQDKEIIVIDDCSTDNTLEVCSAFPVKLYHNRENFGLAGNLNELVKRAKGEIVVLLCGDDVFTHKSVVSDIVKAFQDPDVGVVGRYYYQYLDRVPGAVMTIRGDVFTSSCQPSGIGFRKEAILWGFEDKIFVEIPLMIKKILDYGWDYTILKYDTIAARLHPGVKGNAATCPGYYKTTPQQSPTLNWFEVTGKPMGMYLGLIQIKNRAAFLLPQEIKNTIIINPFCLVNPGFWFCLLTALLVPGCILRRLSNWYRHRITRYFVKVIERGKE